MNSDAKEQNESVNGIKEDYLTVSKSIFNNNKVRNCASYPSVNESKDDMKLFDDFNPNIRVPGWYALDKQLHMKYYLKQIILNTYGNSFPNDDVIRKGYLIKKERTDTSVFVRMNLKLRYFVINGNETLSFYKSHKSYEKMDQSLNNKAIILRGRCIRVIYVDYHIIVLKCLVFIIIIVNIYFLLKILVILCYGYMHSCFVQTNNCMKLILT